MRRSLLVAGLSVSVAALVLALAASASAAELVGSCTIKGTATFGKPLSTKAPEPNTYSFEGGAECSGTIGGEAKVNGKGTAHVAGSGLLSCAASEGTGGTGAIEVEGKEVPFAGFDFVGAGTNVTFAIDEPLGSLATGEATFADDIAGVQKCAKGEEVNSLQFTAVTSGRIG
jgi:hypothetical protein